MKLNRVLVPAMLALSSLALGLVTAQTPNISLYGGIYLPTQNVTPSLEVPKPGVVQLRLERVLDPATLFANLENPHIPKVPNGTKTTLVRAFNRRFREGGYTSINLGRPGNGVYVLRASQGNASSNTLVMVSDLGLVVKRGLDINKQQGVIYTANRYSGQPRESRVWFLQNRGAIPGRTDGEGLFRYSGIARDQNPTVLAQSGNSWAISGMDWNGYAAPQVKGYVYTDRPVYRPGQHVDFKGTLRDALSLKAIAGAKVSVTVKDTNDQEVYKGTLETNAAGSFAGGLQLGVVPAIGTYYINAKLEAGKSDESYSGDFLVEAYEKPEFAVTVTAPKPRAVQGQKVPVIIGAEYLFGGAVSGARVNYSVTRARYYSYSYDGETYDYSDEERDYGSELVIDDQARLDAKGQLTLELPLEKNVDGLPTSYRIEAQVEDESRKTVTSTTRVIAFPSSINISGQLNSYIYKAGEAIQVALETKDLADKGVPSVVSLELVRQDWVQKKGEWTQTEEVVATSSARTNAQGVGVGNLTAKRSGGYLIRSRVKDASGRVSKDENFAWVIKPGEDWYWNYSDLQVKLDQRTYKPGQTATALIGSPKAGTPVLVTLEREGVMSARLVRSSSSAIRYSFPISKEMAPNVFLSAVMLQGESIYERTVTVRVPDAKKKLEVSVKADKAKYKPGETGKLEVSVTDSSGKGTAGEVGLGVVDEAIYLVQPDRTTNITSFFHGSRDNAVGTSNSLYFNFESVNALAAPKPALTRAAFAQAKEDLAQKAAAPENKPRQDFKDTIVWMPYLVTDANGKATVDVTFPDNLTTWRATARALDTNGRAGQGTGKTLVTKDVIARISKPPYLVRGDTSTISAIVNNTLETPVKGTLNVEFDGLTSIAKRTSSQTSTGLESALEIAAKGRVRTDYPVLAERTGTASITASATTSGGQDALKLPLEILPRGYRENIGWAGDAESGAKEFKIGDDANLETAKLQVFVTPSLTSAVAPALEYLVGYPYGCTEQTMSRFLPALLAKQTLGSNGLSQAVTAQLPEIMQIGLKRLETFQHEDGGWGFWQWDDSTLEMTSYVLRGLVRAKSLGQMVKNDSLDRAVKYLRANARDNKQTSSDRAAAYRALSEAKRADLEGMGKLARRSELVPDALANLALAYAKSSTGKTAQDLIERLKAKRKETDRGVHWENPRQQSEWYWWDYWSDNPIQTTAHALEAITRVEGPTALTAKVSSWLLAQRKGRQWVSTQDTASVIEAALSQPKTANVTLEGSVKINGEEVATLDENTPVNGIEIPAESLQAGTNTLEVISNIPTLTYSAQLETTREPEILGASGSDLKVTRKFDKLESRWDEANKRYRYERIQLSRQGKLEPVTVGDLVLVTIQVKASHPMRYVMVSDPLPAGLRPVDERTLAISGLDFNEEWDSWNYWYSGREFRDERVDLYADYLNGTQVLRYVLRATTPGQFTALPSQAFMMYDPDIKGQEKAVVLIVRDRGQ
jgi:alpha-2-macroglobulin